MFFSYLFYTIFYHVGESEREGEGLVLGGVLIEGKEQRGKWLSGPGKSLL